MLKGKNNNIMNLDYLNLQTFFEHKGKSDEYLTTQQLDTYSVKVHI